MSVHFKIIIDYSIINQSQYMEIMKCKCCGKELRDMPPDAKYCSIECTYGIPDFKKETEVYP